MNLPTLSETAEFISKCIASCETQQHLAICRDMMQSHLKNRYEHYVSARAMAETLSSLDNEIEERRVVIAHVAGMKVYEANELVNVI